MILGKSTLDGNRQPFAHFLRSHLKTLVAILVLSVVSVAQGQVSEEWISRFDDGATEYPRGLAVDDAGNVYVTGVRYDGFWNYDYVTVKYSAEGEELWRASYDNDIEDYTIALTLDTEGNVYVTGQSFDNATLMDALTIKYDMDGNELWTRRFDELGGWDYAMALAMDKDGNLYVTGTATVKYDRWGNELWWVEDGGIAIALDEDGYLYIFGQSEWSDITGQDFFTAKYDPNGEQIWSRRRDFGEGRPNGDMGAGGDLALDSMGNVYVTGQADREFSYPYATVKYDADGNELWVRLYEDGNHNYPADIEIDRLDNVYVTGTSSTDLEGADYATVKYDPEGNEVWSQRYDYAHNARDDAVGLAMDAADNVYVTGRSESDPINVRGDFATVKYDADGNEIWVKRYDHGDNDGAGSIVVTDSGDVYVTGASFDEHTLSDFATIMYTQALTPEDGMASAIAFYENALEEGTIYGIGQGASSTVHERSFEQMLHRVSNHIVAGKTAQACQQIDNALLRIDGTTPPPDFVSGPDVPTLYEMLGEVFESLECSP